jgi:hypothetical protein
VVVVRVVVLRVVVVGCWVVEAITAAVLAGTGEVVTVGGSVDVVLLSAITGPGMSGKGRTWAAGRAASEATTANTVATTMPATPSSRKDARHRGGPSSLGITAA